MGEVDFPVGVEEEYQLVDPDTGALRGRAPAVLAAAGGVAKAEFQRTILEVASPVCASAAEAAWRAAEGRLTLLRAAAAQGLAIASAGLHPVGAYPPSQVTDEPRYRELARSGGSIMRDLHIFGLHVHVGVPGLETAVRAMVGATPYTPHLLALCASSPFHQGADTGFASFRTIIRDMFPEVGPALPVTGASEYTQLVRILAREECDERERCPVSWDIRPSARYPTLEFRFFDACPWVDDVMVLVAFARALTAMFADRPPPQRTGMELQLLKENRWRAARYGLDARFFRLDPVTGEQRPARDQIMALAERLYPLAERLGDGAALAGVERMVRRGTAAEAMRGVLRREGSFPAVTRWVMDQTSGSAAAVVERRRRSERPDRGDLGAAA
jgi:YbdK family carboxylate-amine ligase